MKVTSEELNNINASYVELYTINRNGVRILDQLVDQGILNEHNGEIGFKYPYFYYYFTASYLRDHINTEEIRNHIRRLSQSLFIENNANILLFLAHLSKDPVILQEMLNSASNLYSAVIPLTFTEDMSFLGDLSTHLSEAVYEERDPNLVRRSLLKSMDDRVQEAAFDGHPDNFEDHDQPPAENNPLEELNASLKTLQILGQILKNFPGSLEGATKVDIAQACYLLGLRTLGGLMRILKDNQEEVLQYLIEIIRTGRPNMLEEEIKQDARASVIRLAELASLGMILRISQAVGSAELDRTYSRIVEETESPAIKLVDIALDLDYLGGPFPNRKVITVTRSLRNNHFARTLLQRLVVHHFHLFSVPYDIKQSICSVLGISYSGVQISNPRRRLLPPPHH